jgi:hypothetical protein
VVGERLLNYQYNYRLIGHQEKGNSVAYGLEGCAGGAGGGNNSSGNNNAAADQDRSNSSSNILGTAPSGKDGDDDDGGNFQSFGGGSSGSSFGGSFVGGTASVPQPREAHVDLDLCYPVKNGLVQSWQDMECIYDHLFKEMKVKDPGEHQILLSESVG